MSVLGSRYPAATVLPAMALLGERLHCQQIGLALAPAAVTLIAAA
ncbi:hypothetical protein OH799_16765 [Nocardia sp. NBC_00881]|nr:hypothetical protein OH799_16765 [Nocardia sp. NBC_00881]